MIEGDVSKTDLKNLNSTKKDNGNIVVAVDKMERFIHLPFNKKDKYFRNPDDFIRFIKACENAVRKSPEYTRYIAYLKVTVGLQSCALFPNITQAQAPLEFHHGPVFTLYDIIEIQIAHLFKNGDRINSSNVAHNVLKDHFDNIIQGVMLCEAAHKGVHAFQKTKDKKFFLPMDAAWGDLGKFLEKYHESFTMQHVLKLKRYLQDYEKYSAHPEKPSLFAEDITLWANKFEEEGEK